MEKTLICHIKECIEEKLEREGYSGFIIFPYGDTGQTGTVMKVTIR